MIADKIKNARTIKKLTQEQVAEDLNVSRQTISNWENGKSLPDIVSIIRMSELYDLSLNELLKGDATLLNKIERDMKVAKAENNVIKFSLIYYIDLHSVVISCNFEAITILIHLWNFLLYFSYSY